MTATAYLWDRLSLEHDTGPHVECIARAEFLAPERMLELVPGLNTLPVSRHDAVAWITELHSPAYHEFVAEACRSGRRLLDEGDTHVCPRSYDAAIAAVDAVLTAADAVMDGSLTNAFCAIRPPGHHALPIRAMGFCLFGNVAILAHYLQKHHGLQRIAIVDWDVHHGNGTQDIFYDDPTVLFISLHQFPLWPGTGRLDEVGEGPGRGMTLNIPIPPATSEADYLERFERDVLPKVTTFRPDCILISAGFDAHRADPLGGLLLTEVGFARMTNWLKSIALDCCNGRIISCLEGGYNLPALQATVAAHVRALAE